MSDMAIKVEGLGKRYELGELRSYETIRESVMRLGSRLARRLAHPNQAKPRESFWALKDVSFEVKRGEVVGIIGRNGAGKSTLLKILSRITDPTEGRAELHGRVGSLLEVGTGFHPELTGRENIFLNGAILGMTRSEIKAKFDEIVAFAEVEKFLDTPVKKYSSGMYVRLAFAVAAHLEPEILIVDEVLAVGDQTFQNKCLGKMSSVAHEGRTVLFVSHNMPAIESLCDSAILLDRGRIEIARDSATVIERYLQNDTVSSYSVDLSQHPGRAPQCTPVFQRLRLAEDDQTTLSIVHLGQPVVFEMQLRCNERFQDAALVMHIHNSVGLRATCLHSRYQHSEPLAFDGQVTVSCRMQSCQLIPGRYTALLLLYKGRELVDRIDAALSFEVVPRDFYGTGRLPPARDGVYVPFVQWQASPSSDTAARIARTMSAGD